MQPLALHHHTMPTLLGLPNEILHHIINDVHVDDIEAFSSCCKEIKVLAAVRLAEHLARKFNYPTVAIETSLISTSLLRDFLMDEKNTLYPRTMSIAGIPESMEDLHSEAVITYLAQHQGLEDKIAAKVMQIQKSLYTEMPAVEAQDWINRIKKGDFDATAALLINLFPNVKTLRVSCYHSRSESLLVRTLERLTSSAAKRDPRALDAFRELSEIDLLGWGSRNYDEYGKLMAAFMILPSVRVIKAFGILWFAGDSLHGLVTSSVKEISLRYSGVDSINLISCIKRIKMLERFTYDLSQNHQTTSVWEPRLTVKALRKYARSTLVHLELTGEMTIASSTPADSEPFIGTLRSFQVLESIRLMTMMLFKPIDGEDIDESENIIESTTDDLVHSESLVEPRRLVDFLPSSARNLALVGGISNEEARDMFADLPKLRRDRVPKLGEIVLEDSDPLEQDTKDLCKNTGIRLKSIKRVVNGYQRIYAITKPAPQVDGLEH